MRSVADMLTCPQCGKTKRAEYAVCWRCHKLDGEKAEYRRGFEEGFKEGLDRGRLEGITAFQLDTAMWRRLLQLCHPDKHANSDASLNAANWLNSIRPLLLEKYQ